MRCNKIRDIVHRDILAASDLRLGGLNVTSNVKANVHPAFRGLPQKIQRERLGEDLHSTLRAAEVVIDWSIIGPI